MASKFQSRLVGTIILAAIGIIFLPDLFDGQKTHYQEEFASIPLQPNDEAVYTATPVLAPEPLPEADVVPSELVLPVDSTDVALRSQEEARVPITPEKTQFEQSSWAVQLGVFRNFNNASSLVSTLQEAGYQAHVLPEKPKDGELARVLVGPDLSRDKLDAELDKLQKITGLRGRLVKFNPLNP
ncbi:SPOR domain-containing protein [Thaumasiovibrio sp. DFM-14]|uniref:SPOR domain-containing protein n=1 Tax=Thaumasiovibrio sp. DFM-14 TaxID=3384792 RepID=UPI0039A1BE6E